MVASRTVGVCVLTTFLAGLFAAFSAIPSPTLLFELVTMIRISPYREFRILASLKGLEFQ
jgi:hypothetical protein